MNTSANLIDNIIVSRDIYVAFDTAIIISDISDHFPCIAKWSKVIKNKKSSINTKVKKLDEKLLPKIIEELKCDWNILHKTDNINESYQLLHLRITDVLDKYIEEKDIRISYKKLFREPRLTKGIVNSNNKQLLLYKEWLMNKNATYHERYKQYRDTLRKIKRRCKFEYYNVQCERFKHCSKKLWAIIHKVCGKTNDKSTSLNYLTINGIKQYQSQKICNEFADFFSNIGKCYAKNIPESKNSIGSYLNKIPTNNKSLFLNPCDPVEIRKIILSLKNKKSSGHDGISNILLKSLSDVLATPLSIVFNQSPSCGIFPDIMKLAEVIPLHKSGSKHLVDNYRLISLLMTISKILEKVVYTHVYAFLDSTSQLYSSQYGFHSKHSCEDAISELTRNILKSKEKGEHTISVFLDLSKAFDTLDYNLLYRKLKIYGI